MNLIESGTNDAIEWLFTSNQDKFFLRLRHSDILTSNPFEADFDEDKVSNYTELWNGTDPLHKADTDADGMPDDWKIEHDFDPANASDASLDTDNDGLTNAEEYQHNCNPRNPDTDGDLLSDGAEVNLHGTNPLSWDTDDDGLGDWFEVTYGLDPNALTVTSVDTDGDGLDLLQEQAADTDPTNADTDNDGVSDGAEIDGGTNPTLADTDGDGVPDKFEITFKAVTSYKGLTKYGFDTYQTTTPPERYLKQVQSWSAMSGGNPESGPLDIGPGTRTQQIDPLTGAQTSQSTGVGGSYAHTSTSPTTAHDTLTIETYDDPPNQLPDEDGTVTADAALSIQNTTVMLRQNAHSLLPPYPSIYLNSGYAYQDTTLDELYYSMQKLRYKFVFAAEIQAILSWMEMFTPEDNPSTAVDESKDPIFAPRGWIGTGTETPPFEIDPYISDQTKDGRYDIVFVDSVYVDYLSPNTHKIPSNLYAANIRGMDHFVCVKDSGDIYLHAYLNTWIPDLAKDKVTWECIGATITSPALYGDRFTAKLSSATPGQYPITMKLNGQSLWEGVVWVVWCNISIANPVIVSQVNLNDTSVSAIYHFRHTIKPGAIVTDTDHPLLESLNTVSPPSVPASETTVYAAGIDLSNGASAKWDTSRRLRQKLINPNGIDFALNHNPSLYLSFPDFPSNAFAGNDDKLPSDPADINPYAALHPSVLFGFDPPNLAPLHIEGAVGDTFEVRDHFQEFTRLEIGGVWHIASDSFPWRVHFKFKKVLEADPNGDGNNADAVDLNGDGDMEDAVWTDNGSTKAENNIGF